MTNDPKHYVLKAETGRFQVIGGAARATLWDATVARMKRIRESLGHTHQKQMTNAVAWCSLAQSFHRAAQILNEFGDRIPSDSRPFAFNAALSLELIFKAVLAKKQMAIPSGNSGHNLCLLCTEAQVAVSPKQIATLELMTEEIVWAGRYPVPNDEKRWDDFHDRIFEKHIVRSQVGNVTSARANSETFPNWENYIKIWALAVAELERTEERA